jgi:hypothetical protein
MSRPGDIARQQASYRRGLVLGLTVAESMLLILFALLLALGWVLVKRDREAQRLSSEVVHLQERSRLLEAKVDVLDAVARNQPTDQFFQELVRAREAQAAVAAERKALEERAKALEKTEAIAVAVEKSPDARQKLKELAAQGAQLQKALAKADPKSVPGKAFDYIPDGVALARAAAEAGRTPAETRSMMGDATRAARETSTLKGQVTRLQKELRSVGKGGDYPPCWVTEAGEIEYLFDINLNGDGSLTLKDVTPPVRLADRRGLSLPPQLHGTVGRAAFLSMTSPILAYENAKGCRFYVIARDRTGPTQKDLFKNLLINTVEARFYKSIRP